MILKRLRENKEWSQDQLATMAGLNVRTIQRIESGKKASLESLKSLASVLEVTISTLEQEIAVIDKSSKKWQELPLLFRLNFIGSEIGWLGLSQRKHWIKGEKQVAIFGALLLPFELVNQGFFVAGLSMIVIAYGISLVARMGDKYAIW